MEERDELMIISLLKGILYFLVINTRVLISHHYSCEIAESSYVIDNQKDKEKVVRGLIENKNKDIAELFKTFNKMMSGFDMEEEKFQKILRKIMKSEVSYIE